jgi:hypothetical protein
MADVNDTKVFEQVRILAAKKFLPFGKSVTIFIVNDTTLYIASPESTKVGIEDLGIDEWSDMGPLLTEVILNGINITNFNVFERLLTFPILLRIIGSSVTADFLFKLYQGWNPKYKATKVDFESCHSETGKTQVINMRFEPSSVPKNCPCPAQNVKLNFGAQMVS